MPEGAVIPGPADGSVVQITDYGTAFPAQLGRAAKRLSQVLPPAAVDALLADAEASGTPIDGPEGLLAQMAKAVLERALDVEMADHLGYEHGDPAGHGSGNSRNGHGRKTVLTTAGTVELEVPRDRNGSFTPAIVPKRQRRLGQPHIHPIGSTADAKIDRLRDGR